MSAKSNERFVTNVAEEVAMHKRFRSPVLVLLPLLLLLFILITLVQPLAHNLIGVLIGGNTVLAVFIIWSYRHRLRYWLVNSCLALAVSSVGLYLTIPESTAGRSYGFLLVIILAVYTVVILTVFAPLALASFEHVRRKSNSVAAAPVVALLSTIALALFAFLLLYVIGLLSSTIGGDSIISVNPVLLGAVISGSYIGVVIQEIVALANTDRHNYANRERRHLLFLFLLVPAVAFPVMITIALHYYVLAHRPAIVLLIAVLCTFIFTAVAAIRTFPQTRDEAHKYRKWTLLSVAATSLTLGFFTAYLMASASAGVAPQIVTVPYKAEVTYQNDKWSIMDTIVLDKTAREALNVVIEDGLSIKILRAADVVRSYDDDDNNILTRN
ncbi:MAG: hypothetical protein LC776_12805 [Acidobacteria bacterium]|nr:hypothetical protein [Acidobacteriota bacterium]